MANNRLYLRCRRCGRIIMIAKHFAGPWNCRVSAKDLQDFFDEHFICDGDESTFMRAMDLVEEDGDDGHPEIVRYVALNDNEWYAEIKKEDGNNDSKNM